MRDTIRGTAHGGARRQRARAGGNGRGSGGGRRCESGSGGGGRCRGCLCLPGSGVFSGDVYAAKFSAAIRRERLSSVVDEECAGAIGRDDAETAEGVGDEPDEPAR